MKGQCWRNDDNHKQCGIALGSSLVQTDWICYSDICGN